MKIDSFTEEYDFLSNFYESRFILDGKSYATVEHAYQSLKTSDKIWEEKIRKSPTPGRAKRLGQKCPMKKNWDAIKIKVMVSCVQAKFHQSEDLKKKLLNTGSAYLEEGNTWGDRLWGVCRGSGKNMLGQILMNVRMDLVNLAVII